MLVVRPLIALALLASCQGSPASRKQAESDRTSKTPAAAIEVHDGAGAVLASVSPTLPCRARVDGVELVVTGRPVDVTVGSAHWTADDDAGGTLIKRDGEVVARVTTTTGSGASLGVFRPDGVAIIRALLTDGAARVINGQRVVLRTTTRTSSGIAAGDRTVTGTDDVLLAAILAAPEVAPEVRALAACLRAIPGDRPS